MSGILICVLVLQLLSLVAVGYVMKKQSGSDSLSLRSQCESLEKGQGRLENLLREELSSNRREMALSAQQNREELTQSLQKLNEQFSRLEQAINSNFERLGEKTNGNLQSFATGLINQINTYFTKQEGRFDALKIEQNENAKNLRHEMNLTLKSLGDLLASNQQSAVDHQRQQLHDFANSLKELVLTMKDDSAQLRNSIGKNIKEMEQGVENRLKLLQDDNSQKLDQMRATVDEKLQGTLERRLTESFMQVSERLEQVHRGLGEMQTLAKDVGGLQRVLTNVKMRGTWGEIQLGNLLEQVLTPEQYEKNVAVKPESNERVEFAIKLPGRDDEQAQVWLPIDAKFPQEDYYRLIEAHEKGDVQAAESASKSLEITVRNCANTICSKYILSPHTTDFAIMFLPTEGLYSEVVRRTGLVEILQRECRVVIAGPMTLAALLNSLQMGFRTLAIQKRSSEVWQVLGAVKSEFGKYADVLDKVKKKLQEASNTVESASTRTRVIERNLRRVEALPQVGTGQLALVADPIEEILESQSEIA